MNFPVLLVGKIVRNILRDMRVGIPLCQIASLLFINCVQRVSAGYIPLVTDSDTCALVAVC